MKSDRFGLLTPRTPEEQAADEERAKMYAENQKRQAEDAKTAQIKHFIHTSGIRPRDLKSLETFSTTHDKWLKNQEFMEEHLGKGVIIALLGKRGTGKTLGACKEALKVCRSVKKARYSTANDFYLEIRATYKPEAKRGELEVIADYCLPSLLILDEVHDRGETRWEDRMLTHIVDKRYGDLKDTILIANQTPEEFVVSVGPSIIDRAREGGGVLVYDWKSFRGYKL